MKRFFALLLAVPWIAGAESHPSAVSLKVPFFSDKTDQCGPATLSEVLAFWGKPADPHQLRQEMYLAKMHGTLPMDLMLTAEAHGLKTELVRGDLNILQSELRAGRPILVMLNFGFSFVPVDHYVVVTGFDEDRKGFYMHSAGKENQFISYSKFSRVWKKTDYWTMLTRLPA